MALRERWLWKHDKNEENGHFFESKFDGNKDQLVMLKGAKTMIFTQSENNPRAHIMPSVRWSCMIVLPDNRPTLNTVIMEL